MPPKKGYAKKSKRVAPAKYKKRLRPTKQRGKK